MKKTITPKTSSGAVSFYDFHEILWSDDTTEAMFKRIKHKGKLHLLGYGAHGYAFKMSNGFVLKLTDDKSEAKIAQIIKEHPSKHIIRIKDVFSIPMFKKFGIVMERVRKADLTWQRFASLWYNFAFTNVTPKHIALFEEVLAEEVTPRKYKQQLVWLKCVARYMQKNNIRCCDIHPDNLGKTNRGHVLLDIGNTKPPPYVRLPKLREAK